MKYYVYVSESKINMLFDQIGLSDKEERTTSLEFDLKVLKGRVEKSKGIPANKFKKLNTVIKQLEKEKLVGSITDPSQYIKGCLKMIWTTWSMARLPHSPITFWGHMSEKLTLALAGSKYHLLGEQRRGRTSSGSSPPTILSWLAQELDISKTDFAGKYKRFWKVVDFCAADVPDFLQLKSEVNRVIDQAVYLSHWSGGTIGKYEFIAKLLHRDHWGQGSEGEEVDIILATPLYVALVE